MKEVLIKNRRLESILSNISKTVYDENNLEQLCKRAISKKDAIIQDGTHGASDEYFYKAWKHEKPSDFGWPACAVGTSSKQVDMNGGSQYFDTILANNVDRLQNYLGSPQNALLMLYPKEGYIGWHHNGNAPGYNILFSYSIDGNGCFKYYDRASDKIVTLQDKIGWNVKCGYYPDLHKEPDRVYWHAAKTTNPRLSIAFIVNDRNVWLNMIEDITGYDLDINYLKDQGPLSDLENTEYVKQL